MVKNMFHNYVKRNNFLKLCNISIWKFFSQTQIQIVLYEIISIVVLIIALQLLIHLEQPPFSVYVILTCFTMVPFMVE